MVERNESKNDMHGLAGWAVPCRAAGGGILVGSPTFSKAQRYRSGRRMDTQRGEKHFRTAAFNCSF